MKITRLKPLSISILLMSHAVCLAEQNQSPNYAKKNNIAEIANKEEANDNFLSFDSYESAESIIGEEGGTAHLKNFISMKFPEKSLPANTKVILSTSNSSEVDYVFNETTFMFTGIKRLPKEIRISTGKVPPSSEYVTGELHVGNILNQLKAPSFSVFTSSEHGSPEEAPTIIFNTVEYSYDQQEKKLTFNIPGAAFINNELTNMEYQAIVILAVNRPTKK